MGFKLFSLDNTKDTQSTRISRKSFLGNQIIEENKETKNVVIVHRLKHQKYYSKFNLYRLNCRALSFKCTYKIST